jgi:hypothetical protein
MCVDKLRAKMGSDADVDEAIKRLLMDVAHDAYGIPPAVKLKTFLYKLDVKSAKMEETTYMGLSELFSGYIEKPRHHAKIAKIANIE